LRFATDDHEQYVNQFTKFADRVEVLPDRILLYVNDGDDALREVHAAASRPRVHSFVEVRSRTSSSISPVDR